MTLMFEVLLMKYSKFIGFTSIENAQKENKFKNYRIFWDILMGFTIFLKVFMAFFSQIFFKLLLKILNLFFKIFSKFISFFFLQFFSEFWFHFRYFLKFSKLIHDLFFLLSSIYLKFQSSNSPYNIMFGLQAF